jgi:DNA-binding CsgD family transcriptional regulator
MALTGGQHLARHDDEKLIETWRRAVRHVDTPVLLYDLTTRRILEVTAAAKELLGIDADESFTLDRLLESTGGPTSRGLLAAGVAHALQGRLHLSAVNNGPLDIWYWVRSISSADGPVLGLMGLQAVSEGDGTPIVLGLPQPQVVGGSPERGDVAATLRLDDQWQVSEYTLHSCAMQGGGAIPIGSFILDVVNADSRPLLLCAFALATTGTRVAVWLDGDGYAAPTAAVVSLADAAPGASYVIEVRRTPAAPADRVRDLIRRLRRIAAEIHATELVAMPAEALPADSDERLLSLSSRQREIVTRLARGERVPAIARQMYLAPSTVRNHLGEAFRKFGVHSQAELIELLRRDHVS